VHVLIEVRLLGGIGCDLIDVHIDQLCDSVSHLRRPQDHDPKVECLKEGGDGFDGTVCDLYRVPPQCDVAVGDGVDELVGEPVRVRSTFVRGYSQMPVEINV